MFEDPADERVGGFGESEPALVVNRGKDRGTAEVSDMCRCSPLPVLSENGLGMKVATMPRSAAITDNR